MGPLAELRSEGTDGVDESDHRGRGRLALHLVVLGSVLCALAVLARPGVPWSSDEGAGILQAVQLEEGDGWLWSNPVGEIDPEGEARPFLRGFEGEDGVAIYAAHPLYPLLLAGAGTLLGDAGFVVLSVAGTVAAAALAACSARLLDPRLAVPTLWVVGLASPLFFDANVVLAHSVAAAGAALGAYGSVRVLTGSGPRWTGTLLAALGVALATLLRSEGLLLGVALGVAAGVVAWRAPASRLRATVLAGAALVSTFVAWLAEQLWIRIIVGSSTYESASSSGDAFVPGRLRGFVATWLDTSYGAGAGADAALAVALLAATAAALVHRLRPREVGAARLLLAIGAAGYVVRLVVGPADAVPGLLVAFPIGWVGLLLLTSADVSGAARLLLGVTAGLFALAVLATQYSRGGGLEWGGRYFALAIPIATPVLLSPFARIASSDQGRRLRPWALGAATASTVALVVLALGELRAHHDGVRAVIDDLEDATGAVPPAAETGRPVVAAAGRLLPQLLWPVFDDYTWVVFSNSDVERYEERMLDLEVERVLLFSRVPDGHLERIEHWQEVERSDREGPSVVVLERRDAP